MSHPRTLLPLLLLIGPATLLAGCGGGGGSSAGGGGGPVSSQGTISGKITDLSGTPVPSAVLLLDGVPQGIQPQAGSTAYLVGGASFPQGGYRLANVPIGPHTVSASTTVQGTTYTGATQVYVFANSASAPGFSSTNLVVSPAAQQATVTGKVVDAGNHPLVNAEVFLRFPATAAQGGTNGYASLTALTGSGGVFTFSFVPTQNADGSARTYTAAASYQFSNPVSSDPVFDNAVQSNLTFTAGQTATLANFTVPVHAGTYSALAPTITLVQAFTQPNVPATASAQAVSASAGAASVPATIYDGIRRHLSPAYARLSAEGHVAGQVRRLAAQSHAASATSYTVETDLYFSLPGDTATQPDPNRSQIYGFTIFEGPVTTSNPQANLSQYAFLQDPLANFFADPVLGSQQVYAADQDYAFVVESDAASNTSSTGLKNLGDSATAQVIPLSFVNMVQPADPFYSNNVVQTLSNPPTIQWNTVSPGGTSNSGVVSYSVFLYSAFPGVNTTGSASTLSGVNPSYIATYTVPASGTNPQTFTVPANVVQSGHEYWVVVAATATDNTSQSQAISVSQITPFLVR